MKIKIFVLFFQEAMILEHDVTRRRYSKVRLYNAGRILHLARNKPSQDNNRFVIYKIIMDD